MKQQVHGNVTGVRDTLIEALGQLYDYEVDEDTFLPRELMQVLARFTGVLNREIAVYITRDGEVVDVSTALCRDVELRDYRLRRNTSAELRPAAPHHPMATVASPMWICRRCGRSATTQWSPSAA